MCQGGGIRGQLEEVGFLFPPYGSWGSNSGQQSWPQSPLLAEPFLQPDAVAFQPIFFLGTCLLRTLDSAVREAFTC